MADINIAKDCKLIKVLADQAKMKRVDQASAEEAAAIIKELAQNYNRETREQIAQTIAFTVDELQQGALDFLSRVADEKNINYGERAAFNVGTRGIKAYYQAKGSTTPRSYVAGKQIFVDTEEISARPAINIMDLRTGRVNMADLIRQANVEMTNMKLKKIESVLHAGISNYNSPFYASGSAGQGIVKPTLDAQLNYFRRLGPVSLLGDIAAVAQLAPLTGMAINANDTQHSDNQIDENNNTGFIGRYNGCEVLAMNNAYEAGSTTPILNENWLYILPGNVSGDMRNLKVVNEGSVSAFEAQNIDDLTYEVRLDQQFGAAFVTGELPTIGAYLIN